MTYSLSTSEGPSPMVCQVFRGIHAANTDSLEEWPLSWRIAILLNISFYNMMGNVFAAGISPLFELLIRDLHCTSTQASRLPGYALLMLGLANLYALPLSGYIGKSHTIRATMLVFLGCNIWSAQARSYASLAASRFVGGFAGGVVEALGPSIIAECFPARQLARAMVVYVGFLAAGSAVGPIVAGAVATGLDSWRWFFSLSAIAVALNLAGCILMLPETTHADVILDGSPAPEAAAATPHPGDAVELRAVGAAKSASASTLEAALAYPPSDTPPHRTTRASLRRLWTTRTLFTTLSHDAVAPPSPLALLRQQAALLLAPAVALTTLVFGLTIGWTVAASVVLAAFYSAPPYRFSAWRVGALNAGPLVGLCVGIPVGGAAADFLSNRHARQQTKHAGDARARDPRHRLPAVLIGGVVSPLGCLLIGYSLEREWGWGATAAAWGALAFGLTGAANVLLTFCVDCFPQRAGHVGVLVNVVKNAVAFGVSYGSLEWFARSGAVGMWGCMAGVLWACYVGVVGVWVWSDGARRWSERFV